MALKHICSTTAVNAPPREALVIIRLFRYASREKYALSVFAYATPTAKWDNTRYMPLR